MKSTTAQALVFKARMQVKETLKEKQELLEVWEDNTMNTSTEVAYYEARLNLEDTPQVELALRNAYHKHERACTHYNNLLEEISDLEKAVKSLEEAEYYLNW